MYKQTRLIKFDGAKKLKVHIQDENKNITTRGMIGIKGCLNIRTAIDQLGSNLSSSRNMKATNPHICHPIICLGFKISDPP